MLQLHPTYRNAGYCCTGSVGMSVQVTSGQWPMCMSVLLSPDQQPRHHCHRVSRHIQHYACLIMWHWTSICLKPSSYVCNSFMRLAGMLQYHCFKHCFEPTGMSVAIAPNHLAHRLQLNSTSMHVCWSCIYKQTCLNQLQLTNKHICTCVAEPTGIHVMLHLPQTRRYVPMLVPN